MDLLLKTYKEKCSEEFLNYGFKTFRNNHYRVINDIFQSFNLHQSVSGGDCTVEFIILPLAINQEIDKSTCGADHLKVFEDDFSWFSYNRNSTQSINLCVDTLIVYMKKYLMAFFENGINSKMAYKLICDFEKKHHDKNCCIYDDAKFCLSLINQDYFSAETHLKAMIKQSEYAYARNMEVFGNDLSTEYINNTIQKICDEKKLLEHVKNRNVKFVEDFLLTNKKKNKKSLGII